MRNYLPIENVIIKNKNTNQVVFSRADGNFQIKVSKDDSILIASQGFHTIQIIIQANYRVFRQIQMQ